MGIANIGEKNPYHPGTLVHKTTGGLIGKELVFIQQLLDLLSRFHIHSELAVHHPGDSTTGDPCFLSNIINGHSPSPCSFQS